MAYKNHRPTIFVKLGNHELPAEAIMNDAIHHGEVIVLRYEGPKVGRGMREILAPTTALIGKGFGETVGLITDGRFSDGTWGMVVGHVRPKHSWAGVGGDSDAGECAHCK